MVSIVTPSLNQGRFIEETILSVKNQTYPRIEHIVVDGGSTDETLDILRKYGDSLIWMSEPDSGQSDAINKGWRMANGEILAYLNSDDTYMPWAVQTAVEFLAENPGVAMVYGNGDFTNEHGEVTRHYETSEFDLKRMLCSHNHVPQPTVFFRKEVLDEIGYFDTELHLAMDQDYWIRISVKFRIEHVPKTLATMRFHPGAKIPSQYHRTVYDHLRILDKFYAGPDPPQPLLSYRRRAYGAVYLRASINCRSAHQPGMALKHLAKAFITNPAQFKDSSVLAQLFMAFLGKKATKCLIKWRSRLR
ncbi:MAG: glycosyltransferase family 2 protein [Dehalococcoidia bacterium]